MERNLGQFCNLKVLFTSELSLLMLSYFYFYFFTEKKANYVIISLYEQTSKTKKHFSCGERKENCPTQLLDIYLGCLTWKLAWCLKSEPHSGRHHSVSVDYIHNLHSEHLLTTTHKIEIFSQLGWTSTQWTEPDTIWTEWWWLQRVASGSLAEHWTIPTIFLPLVWQKNGTYTFCLLWQY